jgi:hypothetical protein
VHEHVHHAWPCEEESADLRASCSIYATSGRMRDDSDAESDAYAHSRGNGRGASAAKRAGDPLAAERTPFKRLCVANLQRQNSERARCHTACAESKWSAGAATGWQSEAEHSPQVPSSILLSIRKLCVCSDVQQSHPLQVFAKCLTSSAPSTQDKARHALTLHVLLLSSLAVLLAQQTQRYHLSANEILSRTCPDIIYISCCT